MTSKGPGQDARHDSAIGRRGHRQKTRSTFISHPVGRGRRFANSTKGCADLIAWLGGFVIARIAFEPTGADHRAFERCLAAAGLPLVKVNPRQARRFPEAIGRHAKSDAVNAAMLGRRHGASDTDSAAGSEPARPW
jgi:transposase